MSGRPRQLAVLTFHRVLPQADRLRPGEVTAEIFERLMRVLARYFHVVPLSSALQDLHQNRLSKRAVSITFDDGYADNYSVALPILLRYGLTATFFVASGYLNGGRMWNDTLIETIARSTGDSLDLSSVGLGEHPITSDSEKYSTICALIRKLKYRSAHERQDVVARISQDIKTRLPANLMMTSDEVRHLFLSGMEIGGHTVHHPILATLSREAAQQEIVDGKRQLEEIIDMPVTLFAYPNGQHGIDYKDEHAELVKAAGFFGAVATNSGYVSAQHDHYHLPRMGVWDHSSIKFGLRLWAGYVSA